MNGTARMDKLRPACCEHSLAPSRERRVKEAIAAAEDIRDLARTVNGEQENNFVSCVYEIRLQTEPSVCQY